MSHCVKTTAICIQSTIRLTTTLACFLFILLDIILACITTLLTNEGETGGGDSGVRSITKNNQEENSQDMFIDASEDNKKTKRTNEDKPRTSRGQKKDLRRAAPTGSTTLPNFLF